VFERRAVEIIITVSDNLGCMIRTSLALAFMTAALSGTAHAAEQSHRARFIT
jgi:hypothetical protein